MSLVVNTNIGSLNAQRSLASSSDALHTAMARLSSGKAINSAADDAAGFAIAERMTAQIRGLNMATKNTNDGLSMLAVAENASDDITDMLQRMRELAVQAANDTNSATDRQNLQSEVQALVSELDRVATQTTYNGQAILNGSMQSKSIQVGTDANQSVGVSVGDLGSVSLGLSQYQWESTKSGYSHSSSNDYVNASDPSYRQANEVFAATFGYAVGDTIRFVMDLGQPTEHISQAYTVASIGSTFGADAEGVVTLTQNLAAADQSKIDTGYLEIFKATGPASATIDLTSDASSAITSLETAIAQVSSQRADLGALHNRLEYTVSNLMNVSEYTTAARSRIEDADFAVESARLAKAQVLQQTGTAMLAQANSSSQLVLSLIR